VSKAEIEIPTPSEARQEQDRVAQDLSEYRFGWSDRDDGYAFTSGKGLTREVVAAISERKGEPAWMRDLRLRAFQAYERRPIPTWGADLSGLDFDSIFYYVEASEQQAQSWEDLPPEILETYEKLGIPQAERERLVAGVAAQYECLAGPSRVLTTRGLVPIKEVEAGDIVFAVDEDGHELRPAPVKAKAQTGVRQTYEVVVGSSFARRIRATDNHPFLVVESYGRGRPRQLVWKHLEDLRVGDMVAVARDVPDYGESFEVGALDDTPERFPRVTSQDLMWLLGLWIGDGHTKVDPDHRTWRVEFAIPARDPELRDEVIRVVDDLFGLKASTPDDWRVTVNSKALVEWLHGIGFAGLSGKKRLPGWAYGLPADERLALLGGYVDADGYMAPAREAYVMTVTSGNESLLGDIAELAVTCGLRPSPAYRFSSVHPFDDERRIVGYRMSIAGPYERVACRNRRRTERFDRRSGYQSDRGARGADTRRFVTDTVGFAPIRSIEPAEVEPVFDIEVDGPHNFVAEGIVVHNSTVLYHKVREDLEEEGVIFLDTDSALQEHEELFREHFATVIPPNDNKFAALNTAVWSGGSFIWIPEGVEVDIPLQAYFRINKQNMGQFERTLIIAEPGSYVHYVEGCLPAGELVTTASGDRVAIEGVRVGDEVLAQTGRPVRVTAVQTRDYRGPLYTFRPVSPDNSFRVTEEHPVLVVPRRDVLVKRAPRNGWKPEVDTDRLLAAEPRWVPAEDVEAGDFLVFPKPRPAPAATVLPIELARLAGYYLADGSASLVNGHKALQFSLHIDDTESVEEIRRLCKELYDSAGSVLWNEEKHEARVLVYTPAGYEAMRHHIGTRSHTKRLSNDILAQDEAFLRHLVETYVRGDGHVIERNGRPWTRAQTTSRAWAHQLQGILARLGTYATINQERPAGPGEILGRQVVRHALYRVQWTEGAKPGAGVRDAGEHFLVPIRDVEVADFDGVVHNLDVRAPDSYLASGFAVHNCTAPIYSSDSLHSAVVEIICKPKSRVRYTTIQNWSNNVYNLVTKRAVAHENATMEWIDGNIGCLAEGSLVTTRGGAKPIEELTPGEEVLSFDHDAGQLTWRRVVAKRYSGEQPVREVRIGERALRVTDNHPFFSYTYDPDAPRKLGRYHLGYVRADHLTEAIVPTSSLDYGEPHKLALPDTSVTFASSNQYAEGFTATRTRQSRLTVDAETTDDLMWLFGLFTGDGSIDAKPAAAGGYRWAKVVLATPESDRARSRLVDVMAALAPGIDPGRHADGRALAWSSVELAELFEANGFTTGARDKRLPAWLLNLPESQRLAFVAGYLDSDGCATRGRRGFSIKSVNRALLEDTAQILTSLGITSRLATEHADAREVEILGNRVIAHGSYRLEFPADPRLLDHVSDDLRAAVSTQQPLSRPHFRRVGRSSIELPETVEIRSVEVSDHLETVPTWDIEVEGTANFVSQGFIVHNSKVTMKYPAVWLMGEGAKGEVLSVAYANDGQHQDAGAKMVHAAPYTTSNILSKSISKGLGRTSYRGLVTIDEGAHHARSAVKCDALMLDATSRSDTYPYMEIQEDDATIEHEATVSKLSEDQLFYMQQRGIGEDEATAMIVRGFIEPIARELPMEYAVELNRLIALEMEGAIG
jgi:Fe-S cluster assembly scaffold protein SufB